MSYESTALAHQRFIAVKPTSNITGTAFNGSIQMNFTVPSLMQWVPKESYLSMRIKCHGYGAGPGFAVALLQNTWTTETILTKVGTLANNPVSCLFDRITHRINDITVSQTDYIPMCSTAGHIIGDSRATLDTTLSTCPIYVQKGTTRFVTANNAAVTSVNLSNMINAVDTATNVLGAQSLDVLSKNKTVAINHYKTPYAYTKMARLNWRPPIGIFQSDNTIPEGCKNTLEFQVSTNCYRQFLQWYLDASAGPPPTGLSTSAEIGPSVVAGADNILISIEDMTLYLSLHDSESLSVPKSIKMNYTDYWITTKSLNSTQNQTITAMIPQGSYKICVFFVDSRYGNNTLYSPTDFNPSGATNSVVVNNTTLFSNNLTDISLTYAGGKYPLMPYNMTNGLYTTGVADNTDQDDQYRAFEDFVIQSDALSDSAGMLHDFRSWTAAPIFMWRLYKASMDMSTSVDVNIRTKTDPVNVLMVIMTMFSKQLDLEYDGSGRLVNTTVAERI